jgi:hypothetical protein
MNIGLIKNPSQLDTETGGLDIRRDLHVFCGYVRDRDVKRGHRDNALSKADARRLAKLLSGPEAEHEIGEDGNSTWVDFVDQFAHLLGLVHYNTKGVYAGYTSQSPSYPDNYIKFDAKAYEKLVSMTLARQETLLLESLLEAYQGGSSEFYSPIFSSRLDSFSSRGSATAVMPMLDFAAIRRFLLDFLARCPAGEWLSVASLVEHLKRKHRYFLIPQKPQFRNKWEQTKGRYGNFHESQHHWGHEIDISEKDPDAFERVEGRYVERFLEGIPRLLGYVEVAYAKQRPKGVYPSRGYLQAFRVSERLQRALEGSIAEPTLCATPSFEVYVQSELYPACLLRDLAPLCELVSEDTTTVFRLDRQRVAAACAADSKLDPTRLLESLSATPLPANVCRELTDWSAHSDKFVLYSGCALLETNADPADIERYLVENIAAGIDVVRSPTKVYEKLEQQQLAPLRIKHGGKSLSPLPVKTRSAFPRTSATKKKRREPKTKVTLMRVTRVQLLCPDREFLDRLQRLLADANCPVEADRKRLALAYSNQYEKEVGHAIRTLKKEFEVQIDDQ